MVNLWFVNHLKIKAQGDFNHLLIILYRQNSQTALCVSKINKTTKSKYAYIETKRKQL